MNHPSCTASALQPRGNDASREANLLTLAAEASGVGLWWLDPQGGRIGGNSAFWDLLLGDGAAEECGSFIPVADFLARIHSGDQARLSDQARNALNSGKGASFQDEFRFLRCGSGESVRVTLTGKVTSATPERNAQRLPRPYLVGTIQVGASENHVSPGRDSDEARLRAILNTMPQMVWSTRPDGYHDYYNDRWYEFTGVPYGSTDGEAWNGMFHSDDQPRAWERWRRSLATGEPYEIEYRLRRRDGVYRWTLGRALPIRHSDGTIERWFGTCTDIHDLKSSEEQRELISRELSHRIKNIFTVVSSLITLTSRRDAAVKPFATGLVQRLNSLAHVHEYIQPHNPWDQADPASRTVLGLLDILVRPYMHDQAAADSQGAASREAQFVITGVDAPVGAGAGTALALIIHELATNAVKYGSLSRPEGRVTICGEHVSGGQYRLIWQERGGPVLMGPPAHQGFGTMLAYRGATGQLGAQIEQDWAAEGLTVRLTMPLGNLER